MFSTKASLDEAKRNLAKAKKANASQAEIDKLNKRVNSAKKRDDDFNRSQNKSENKSPSKERITQAQVDAVTTKQIKAAQAVADKAQAAYAAAKTKQKRPGSKVTNQKELYVAQREATNTVNELMEEFAEQNKTKGDETKSPYGGFKTAGDKYGGFKTAASKKQAEAKAAKAKAAKAKAKSKARGKKAQESPGSGSSPTGDIGKRPRGPAGPTGDTSGVKIAKKQPPQSKDKAFDDGVSNPRKAYTQDGTGKKKDSLESALDTVKSLVSSVTPKMESFFGLNRTDEQIKEDMAKHAELEERDFRGGKKKGGRVSKPSRKKYSMNKGGKVASIRKPTRA